MTLVVAHRGASAGHRDNSLEAFEGAILAGADMLEFDVRRTADDQLIAFHDAHVRRRPVAEQTRAEIAAATGHAPPLLAEVLALAHGRIGVDVELKEGGYVPEVLAALTAARLDRDALLVSSFLDAVVAEVGALAPGVRTGLLVGTDRPGLNPVRTRLSELSPAARARACGAASVGMHFLIASLGALERTHAAGLGAFVWTVNRDDALRRFLADPRVEAVITDLPARALALRDGVAPPG